jgi:hypothetical protein
MPNILDEYLVKLGAVVDQSGMARFQQALREASSAVDLTMVGMAGAAVKATTEIVSGFVAVGTAALGLVDKVAMADQDFRLFALHMYMSKDAARSLKVAMDALGQPLENLMWDQELRERTRQLIADQRAMAPGGDFEAEMRKIRDIRFEFTRLEVEAKYLGMHVVQDFLGALGVGPDWLLSKLRSFNQWVISDLPAISKKIVTWFMPVWKDIVMVVGSAGMALREFGKAFTNLVGAVLMDPALESGTFSIQKLGVAIQYVAAIAGTLATGIAFVVDVIARLVSVISELLTLQWSKIPDEMSGLFEDTRQNYGAFRDMIHSLTVSRAALLGQDVSGGDGSTTAAPPARFSVPGVTDESWQNLAAATHGAVSADLLKAVAYTESGPQGMGAVSPKGAIGIMQLMPATAKAYGVDPHSGLGNLTGGTAYLRDMIARYGGDVAEGLGAYNAGPGRMDAFLAGKATLPEETKTYIADVLRRAGRTGDVNVGGITIHITQPGASADEIARKTADETAKRTQRTLQEWSQLSYGY